MSQSVVIIAGKSSPRSADPFAWRELRAGPELVSKPRRRALPVRTAFALTLVAALGGFALYKFPLASGIPSLSASLHLPWRGAEVRVENVTSRIVDQGRTLLVEGAVVNTSGRDMASPLLRLAVRSADQAEIFVWSAHTAESHLAPDARTRFSSKLASPPNGGVEVTVALQPAGN